MSLGR